MNKLTLAAQIDVSVVTSSEVVAAEIRDRRSDSTHLFHDLNEKQREELAVDAWSIGLRALSNAYSQAQEARLQDVGTALISDVDRQLQAHVAQQQETIAAVLSRFFDPKDGQVMQRLDAFVDDQGVLARLLVRQIGSSFTGNAGRRSLFDVCERIDVPGRAVEASSTFAKYERATCCGAASESDLRVAAGSLGLRSGASGRCDGALGAKMESPMVACSSC